MLGIVIPVFNRSDKLKNALHSLEQQTKKQFITIVCDDCSSEDIYSVTLEFNSTLNIVYLKNNENSGPAYTRQRGLDWCKDNNISLIMFLDSDDLLFENAVEVLTYEINHGLYDLVASSIAVEHHNEPQTLIEAERSLTWLHGKIYRVDYLKKLDLNFFADLRMNEDLAFNELAYWGTKKKAFIEAQTYLWRDDKTSLTRDKDFKKEFEIARGYIDAVFHIFTFSVEHNILDGQSIVKNLFACYNYYQTVATHQYCTDEILYDLDKKISTMMSYPPIKQLLSLPSIWRKNLKLVNNYVYSIITGIRDVDSTFICWIQKQGISVPGGKQ